MRTSQQIDESSVMAGQADEKSIGTDCFSYPQRAFSTLCVVNKDKALLLCDLYFTLHNL